MKKTLLAWLPVCLWALVIFLFSSLPTIPTPFIIWWDVFIKKTAHFVEFAILAILLFRALHWTYKKIKDQSTLLITTGLFSVIYAISDEFHQRLTPGRIPTVRDVVIDTLGVVVALLVIKRFTYLKNKYPKLAGFIFFK
ncbi:MAG: VanZ family protein [Patescibacteria group bacterium]|jgi:VanZ family protein